MYEPLADFIAERFFLDSCVVMKQDVTFIEWGYSILGNKEFLIQIFIAPFGETPHFMFRQ